MRVMVPATSQYARSVHHEVAPHSDGIKPSALVPSMDIGRSRNTPLGSMNEYIYLLMLLESLPLYIRSAYPSTNLLPLQLFQPSLSQDEISVNRRTRLHVRSISVSIHIAILHHNFRQSQV